MRLLEDRGAPSPCWGALRPGPNVRAPPGRGQACCPCTTYQTQRSASPASGAVLPLPYQNPRSQVRGATHRLPQCQSLSRSSCPFPDPSKGEGRGRRQGPSVSLSGLSSPNALCTGPRPGAGGQVRGTSRGPGCRPQRESLTLASLLLQMGALDRPDVLKGAKPRACSATAAGPRTQSSVGQGLVTCRSSLHPQGPAQGPAQGPTCVTGQGGVWSTPQAVSLL